MSPRAGGREAEAAGFVFEGQVDDWPTGPLVASLSVPVESWRTGERAAPAFDEFMRRIMPGDDWRIG